MPDESHPPALPPLAEAGYRSVPDAAGGAAARGWWDANAEEYLAEHGEFLGSADLLWCPEGLRESDAHLLGDVAGAVVLEVGAGAAQGSRWLRARGARAVATDVSAGMLRAGRRLDAPGDGGPPLVQADARALPFADGGVDVAFTAYGALPFVPDPDRVHAEVARVLRPGGRWVFSVTHPVRWAFPDVPTAAGLTVARSYFDRRPYVETAEDGTVLYAEYHRTVGDHVGLLVAAGFVLEALVEPEWPAGHDRVWGGWGPQRASLPGTAIFCCRLPG
ncbi:class I SAM-dependent methyltransferase [Cellulomonas marina]|uniref:Methyltransferase domain-containing protein n=1 Tax=Cellulomonas marina TaxID=988821 RepID=A0A1I0ZYD6_9CELL|nr:class I SAM-dependent methyltransferase [Cellulomonas marina]GIG29456.1 SAM-dependent methyltransferase [Cellulomonas marina]SFB30567.1 Methyltransferase domain-containing protein [Cellulomonas marina]